MSISLPVAVAGKSISAAGLGPSLLRTGLDYQINYSGYSPELKHALEANSRRVLFNLASGSGLIILSFKVETFSSTVVISLVPRPFKPGVSAEEMDAALKYAISMTMRSGRSSRARSQLFRRL